MRRITAIAKSLERFSTGKPCKRGHWAERYTSTGQCVDCVALFASNYEHNPKRVAYRRRVYEEKSPAAKLLQGAKYRARAAGKEFSLTEADIFVPSVCPCCGILLVSHMGRGKLSSASPTLDRLDNTFGYIQGNIWVICYRCNSIKRDANSQELRNIADALDRKIWGSHLAA